MRSLRTSSYNVVSYSQQLHQNSLANFESISLPRSRHCRPACGIVYLALYCSNTLLSTGITVCTYIFEAYCTSYQVRGRTKLPVGYCCIHIRFTRLQLLYHTFTVYRYLVSTDVKRRPSSAARSQDLILDRWPASVALTFRSQCKMAFLNSPVSSLNPPFQS